MSTKMEADGLELAGYEVDTIPDTRLLKWNMLVLSVSLAGCIPTPALDCITCLTGLHH